MYEELKKEIKEIIKIAESCPTQFQNSCFEVLFKHLLEKGSKSLVVTKIPEEKAEEKNHLLKKQKSFEAFCKSFDLSEQQLEKVLHFDDSEVTIIVGDLKSKKKTERQVKLGLLLGIKNLYLSGSPDIPWDELRKLCEQYVALDAANFAGIMKKNKDIFVPIKDSKDWKLSKPGENKAAETIKELIAEQ